MVDDAPPRAASEVRYHTHSRSLTFNFADTVHPNFYFFYSPFPSMLLCWAPTCGPSILHTACCCGGSDQQFVLYLSLITLVLYAHFLTSFPNRVVLTTFCPRGRFPFVTSVLLTFHFSSLASIAGPSRFPSKHKTIQHPNITDRRSVYRPLCVSRTSSDRTYDSSLPPCLIFS